MQESTSISALTGGTMVSTPGGRLRLISSASGQMALAGRGGRNWLKHGRAEAHPPLNVKCRRARASRGRFSFNI